MPKGRVITIGSFDGIHIGHQALVDRTVFEAKRRRLKPMALTFQIPPRMILDKRNKKKILSTYDEKKWLFNRNGIKEVHALSFDRKFSKISPFLFFRNILIRKYQAKGLVVGLDFRFGANRSAGATELVRWGLEYEIPVWAIPPVKKNSKKISSSRIREEIERGHYKRIPQLLGHPYLIAGKVKRERGMGAKLGYPTANIQVDKEKALPSGVFAIAANLKGHCKPLRGVCNIGKRPTLLKRSKVSVEAHILGKHRNFTGRTVYLELLKFIRPEKKFSSKEKLIQAIGQDVRKARRYFRISG